MNNRTYNVEVIQDNSQETPILWIAASRDIQDGEELFLDYGDTYWND